MKVELLAVDVTFTDARLYGKALRSIMYQMAGRQAPALVCFGPFGIL